MAYADDITLIMRNPQNMQQFFETFNLYSKASGATLNKGKQKPSSLETWRSEHQRVPGLRKQKIKLLGQIFSHKNMEIQN